MNQRPQTKKKSSRFKGVGWHKKQKAWRAYIRFADHQVHFGPFKTEVDAAGAYNVAALIFFGDFAHLNRI